MAGYAKYSIAFLKIFIPSPSSGRGLFSRFSSSLRRVQYGWFVKVWKRSGCGIMPRMRPEGSVIAAMSSSAPFGQWGKAPLAGEPFGSV